MSITASVLIVTYNSSETIKECLHSLDNQAFKDFELIIVDNNSKDDTLQIIESIKSYLHFPIKTIYKKENLGFAGGNNLALKYISQNCRYVGLLNPDAKADTQWLQKLVKEMEADKEIGVCASKILTYDGKYIDSAGIGMPATLKGFNRGEGKDIKQYNFMEYVFGACGCAAIYRKQLLDEIGFFDEDFFLIHEDVDICFRAHLAGWKVLFVPESKVYHKVRSSIRKMSDQDIYYSVRNVELVKIKNVPLKLFLIYMPGILISYLTEFYYFVLKHKKMKIYLRAKVDALKLLPKMLEKRKMAFKIKKTNDKYISNLLIPIFSEEFLKIKIKKFLAIEN
jgi:GT2 family glycosyltransferase